MKNSWNGKSKFSIHVRNNAQIFTHGSTYIISANITYYNSYSLDIVDSEIAEVTIYSNTRPDLSNDICTISPLSRSD